MAELRTTLAILALSWLALGQAGCGGQVPQQEKGPTGPTAPGAGTAGVPGPSPTPAGQGAIPTAPSPTAPAGRGGPVEGRLPGTPGAIDAATADRLVESARQDLARREGVADSEIAVVVVASETWRDASLGCPEAGKIYAQVLTPGYRIVLGARGRNYEYHTDSSRVVLCPNP